MALISERRYHNTAGADAATPTFESCASAKWLILYLRKNAGTNGVFNVHLGKEIAGSGVSAVDRQVDPSGNIIVLPADGMRTYAIDCEGYDSYSIECTAVNGGGTVDSWVAAVTAGPRGQ